jgi:ABC-type uncharacterized transport system substrate-binding protein
MISWEIHVRYALAIIALLGVIASTPARAHPHVWVSVETTVVYDKGAIVALRQRWAFDELYTAMAIQGLDTNTPGVYGRSELAELAKVNIEGLKDFDYFTVVRLGQQQLKFDTPTDYFMEYVEASPLALPGPMSSDPQANATTSSTDTASTSIWSRLTNALTPSAEPQKPKVLVLEFLLPLEKPVLAEAEGFSFSVADPSFFIWFDFARDNPIKLAGAPGGCKSAISTPKQEEFVPPTISDPMGGINFSFGAAKTVTISCPK